MVNGWSLALIGVILLIIVGGINWFTLLLLVLAIIRWSVSLNKEAKK